MKSFLVGALWLLTLASLCGGQPGNAPAGGADDDLDKNLASVRKQIEDFHKKEQALLEKLRKQQQPLLELQQKLEQEKRDLERKKLVVLQKAEEEERKHHYARMEIKGRLHKVSSGTSEKANHVWRIQFGGLSTILDFGANKELQASAEQLAGKRVVITGNLVTARTEQRHVYYYHGFESHKLTVESVSEGEK